MRKLLKERKLFKGGNYMRKYGILKKSPRVFTFPRNLCPFSIWDWIPAFFVLLHVWRKWSRLLLNYDRRNCYQSAQNAQWGEILFDALRFFISTAFSPSRSTEAIEEIWKFWPMWQTKYALAVPENLGVGVGFRPFIEGNFLSECPKSVLAIITVLKYWPEFYGRKLKFLTFKK